MPMKGEQKRKDAVLKPDASGRVYWCESCKKGFNYKQNYIRHMNTHKSVYPIHCEYCGKGYINKGDLQVHLAKNHTNSYDFQCSICQKPFAIKKHLKKHLDTVHNLGNMLSDLNA